MITTTIGDVSYIGEFFLSIFEKIRKKYEKKTTICNNSKIQHG